MAFARYDHDDDLVTAVRADGEPRHRVYACSRVEVVLGRGSRPEVELKQDACARDGVPVTRRDGGGCAVVLDPGNVVCAVAFPAPGLGGNHEHFARITRWLIAALEEVGLPGVYREGVSDLALPAPSSGATPAQVLTPGGPTDGTPGQPLGRKVGGACIHRSRGILFYSATLLVAPRVDLMERYLAHPPREPDYRQGRSHRDFVGHLDAPSTASLAERLGAALRAARIS